MNRRRLGDSDIEVSEISLGSWLTYGGGWSTSRPRPAPARPSRPASTSSTPPTSTASARPRRPGARSSRTSTRGVRPRHQGLLPDVARQRRGLSREQIHKQIDASLERLQTDYVDLYQCHRPDPETPIEETMEALTEVCEAGKAREIGFSRVDRRADRGGPRGPGREEVRLLPAAVQHDLAGARGRADPLLRASTGSRRSSGRRSPRECSPASTARASRHPRARARPREEMGWAMDRYWSDEVLEAVQRLVPIAEDAGLEHGQLALAWVPAPARTSPRRSSAPRGPSRSTTNAEASGSSSRRDTLGAIDEALDGVAVTGPQLANFVEEGVKHR